MKASDLVEIICAAHLGYMVEGPFNERGGLMIVGPPAVLKTTFVSVLDRYYQDAVMMSDINVKSLIRMRDAISSGKVNTLVLPEFAKIYERADVTSKNVEGTIRALAAEGFMQASFEDSRVNRLTARALVVGALTPSLVTRMFSDWEDSGFNRRFLWALMKLKDPAALEKAAVAWARIPFQTHHVPLPPMGAHIPNLTSSRDRHRMAVMVKYQPGGDHSIQIQLLTRILAVLRWWYRETGNPADPMEVLERFTFALGRSGCELELPDPEAIPVPDGNPHDAGRTLARARWKKKQGD